MVLYGNSVLLDAVGQSLRQYPRLDVIPVETSPELAERRLDDLCPHVVVLDLGVVTRDFAFALLRDHPDLMLIGLDPGGDQLLVLSGEQARAVTTDDLVRLIETGMSLAGEENGPDDGRSSTPT